MKIIKLESNFKNIFNKGIQLWIQLLFMLVVVLIIWTSNNTVVIKVIMSILFSAIFFVAIIPSAIIHRNYFKHSLGHQLSFHEDRIILEFNSTKIEILKAEIKSITKTRMCSGSYPWMNFSYLVVQNNKEKIIIPHMLCSEEVFWRTPFAKGLSRHRGIETKSFYPMIKD